MRDLTQHLTTRADDSHAAPVPGPLRAAAPPRRPPGCQGQVRFFALRRIKPHAPPLVRAPVNSFEFQPCGRTPQAVDLPRLLRGPAHRAPDPQSTSFTAWTTRVSNPVRSPRSRTRASVAAQEAAFASGVPAGIYAFHRYTRGSASPCSTQGAQYGKPFRGWAPGFHSPLTRPPACPLRPVIPTNARTPRITAAAGTEFAGASSAARVRGRPPPSGRKCFTTHGAFFTHAAWLRQGSPHCAIFPTAASRRSLGRVSVPMWLAVLSDQLGIVAMVGRCPAIKLIPPGRIPNRVSPFPLRGHAVSAAVSSRCPAVWGSSPGTTHPSAARRRGGKPPPAAARLACIRPAASVQSEP